MALNLEFTFTKVEVSTVQDILNGILSGDADLLSTLTNICGRAGTEKGDACYRALRLVICGELKDINKTLKLIRAKKIKDQALITRVRKYGVMNSTWSREKKPKAKAKATKVEAATVFTPWQREDCNAMIGVVNSNPEVYGIDSAELVAALQVLAVKLPAKAKAKAKAKTKKA
jgi:hypothetical protein